jgi:hypothetical protein
VRDHIIVRSVNAVFVLLKGYNYEQLAQQMPLPLAADEASFGSKTPFGRLTVYLIGYSRAI